MVGFPAFGHQTNDYEEFRAMVAQTDAPDYLGLALYGPQQDRSAASPAASASSAE